MHYVALVHKDADSDFGVSFPDLPGCVTAGHTVDEALSMAKEALALHIAGLVEDGEAIPEASTAGAVWNDPSNHGALFVFVPATVPAAKSIRVNISLPQDELIDIDRYAEEHGQTRSGFLAIAAKYAMKVGEP